MTQNEYILSHFFICECFTDFEICIAIKNDFLKKLKKRRKNKKSLCLKIRKNRKTSEKLDEL